MSKYVDTELERRTAPGPGTPQDPNADALLPQPCCDVVVDESGELRLKIAGDWSDAHRDEQLLTTLRSVALFGAPCFVDTSHLGKTSPQVRALLDSL